MHRCKRGLLLPGLLLLVPNTLLAHDTWLLPRCAAVAPGDRITLDLASGIE